MRMLRIVPTGRTMMREQWKALDRAWRTYEREQRPQIEADMLQLAVMGQSVRRVSAKDMPTAQKPMAPFPGSQIAGSARLATGDGKRK